jgi:hypothetical protein
MKTRSVARTEAGALLFKVASHIDAGSSDLQAAQTFQHDVVGNSSLAAGLSIGRQGEFSFQNGQSA